MLERLHEDEIIRRESSESLNCLVEEWLSQAQLLLALLLNAISDSLLSFSLLSLAIDNLLDAKHFL